MAEKPENKKNINVQKNFLSVGPTLRYSHNNVMFFWAMAIIVYIAILMFWSKLLTGRLIFFNQNWADPDKLSQLSYLIRNPIDIFNYPEQIFILGGLMGIIAIVPILISQLMSLRHSLAFIICYAILGFPVAFSLPLLISSFAVACRPLRFRSRIISVALCMLPVMIYWGIFGSSSAVEPIRAGICYAPWVFAWLVSMATAGAVLGVGHFTRYRPGLVFAFSLLALVTAFTIFQTRISLAELDYQLYVAGNDPQQVEEFYEQDISNQIDQMVEKVHSDQSPFAFYPTNKKLLRKQLIREIQNELRWDRWPRGFYRENRVNFQKKRNRLLESYNKFIHPEKRIWMPDTVHNWLISDQARKKRMPIALYYKGIVSELEPQIRAIGNFEILKFNSDYTHRGSVRIWVELYRDYGQTPESIEARYRLANILAREAKFEKAQELCDICLNMIEKINFVQNGKNNTDSQFFRLFEEPPETVMQKSDLDELRFRTLNFKNLIGLQNHKKDPRNKKMLQRLVSLNPNQLNYPDKLNELFFDLPKHSPLVDNILLAKAMTANDASQKLNKLKEVSDKYPETDGGIAATYQLGVLRVQMWQMLPDDNRDIKRNYLLKSKEIIETFISANTGHYLAKEAKKILNSLPRIE